MMTIEPGWLALALLVGVPLHMILGAALSRPYAKRALQLADEVIASPSVTKDDRWAIHSLMREASKRLPLWVVGATAPLWTIPLFISSVYDTLKGKPQDTPRRQFDHSQDYRDRSRAMDDAALNAALLMSPLLTLWIAIWASPALAVYAVTGAAEVAVARFRLFFEEVTHFAKHQHG